MARRNYRLIRLRPEKAGVAVVDLTQAHTRGIETDHHPRIHGDDHRRRDIDGFHMGDAPASLAMMKGDLPVIPGVDGRGIRRRFLEELRLIRLAIVGP